jgi:site-specific DNA-methyltransferase (adenine-specific)
VELREILKESYYYTKNGMLLYGDCLEWMAKLPDKSVDMVLCDLPYGSTACKWDIVIPFEPLWEQYERITKDNSAIVLFGSQPFTTKLIESNFKLFKYCWYWKKTKAIGFQHSKNKPMKIIEDICVFSKAPMGHVSQLGDKRMRYNPQDIVPLKSKIVSDKWHGNIMGARPNQVGKEYMAFTNFPDDLLEFKQPVGNKTLHPTQKSVDLCEYLIKTYTDDGDVVLDNCVGSGTTAIACENTKRKWICIEKELPYCEITKIRIEGK